MIRRANDPWNKDLYLMRGELHARAGRWPAALADYSRAVEITPRGQNSGWHIHKRRAAAHFHVGDHPKALADLTRALDLNPTDLSTLTWIGVPNIVACPDPAFRQGMIDLATRVIRQSDGAPVAYDTRAQLYAAMNEGVKARADFAEAAARWRRVAEAEGTPGPARDAAWRELAGTQAVLGLSVLQAGQYAEAEPILRECLSARERVLPDSWLRFNAMSMLGGSLLGQGKYAEAEPLLVRGYEGMRERAAAMPPGSPRLGEAVERLVRLYEATGQPAKAAEWRARLPLPVAPPPRPKP